MYVYKQIKLNRPHVMHFSQRLHIYGLLFDLIHYTTKYTKFVDAGEIKLVTLEV